jgi:hypothetical protein
MRVTTENENPQKGSAYLNAGAPKQCFLPSCRKAFEATCLHSHDGHYYCSQECADQARKVDLSRVEDIARRRA